MMQTCLEKYGFFNLKQCEVIPENRKISKRFGNKFIFYICLIFSFQEQVSEQSETAQDNH